MPPIISKLCVSIIISLFEATLPVFEISSSSYIIIALPSLILILPEIILMSFPLAIAIDCFSSCSPSFLAAISSLLLYPRSNFTNPAVDDIKPSLPIVIFLKILLSKSLLIKMPLPSLIILQSIAPFSPINISVKLVVDKRASFVHSKYLVCNIRVLDKTFPTKVILLPNNFVYKELLLSKSPI